MTTVSFTHRIDSDLKAELDQIAQFENRTPSYIANHAIQQFVDERKATRELIETGLALIEANAPSISSEEMEQWLFDSDEDAPFPQGQVAG